MCHPWSYIIVSVSSFFWIKKHFHSQVLWSIPNLGLVLPIKKSDFWIFFFFFFLLACISNSCRVWNHTCYILCSLMSLPAWKHSSYSCITSQQPVFCILSNCVNFLESNKDEGNYHATKKSYRSHMGKLRYGRATDCLSCVEHVDRDSIVFIGSLEQLATITAFECGAFHCILPAVKISRP